MFLRKILSKGDFAHLLTLNPLHRLLAVFFSKYSNYFPFKLLVTNVSNGLEFFVANLKKPPYGFYDPFPVQMNCCYEPFKHYGVQWLQSQKMLPDARVLSELRLKDRSKAEKLEKKLFNLYAHDMDMLTAVTVPDVDNESFELNISVNAWLFFMDSMIDKSDSLFHIIPNLTKDYFEFLVNVFMYPDEVPLFDLTPYFRRSHYENCVFSYSLYLSTVSALRDLSETFQHCTTALASISLRMRRMGISKEGMAMVVDALKSYGLGNILESEEHIDCLVKRRGEEFVEYDVLPKPDIRTMFKYYQTRLNAGGVKLVFSVVRACKHLESRPPVNTHLSSKIVEILDNISDLSTVKICQDNDIFSFDKELLDKQCDNCLFTFHVSHNFSIEQAMETISRDSNSNMSRIEFLYAKLENILSQSRGELTESQINHYMAEAHVYISWAKGHPVWELATPNGRHRKLPLFHVPTFVDCTRFEHEKRMSQTLTLFEDCSDGRLIYSITGDRLSESVESNS